MAIEQALMITSWQENMPSKEIPPDHLWEDIEGLNDWFKALKEERDAPPDQGWQSEQNDGLGEGEEGESEPWQRGDDDVRAGQDVGPGGSSSGQPGQPGKPGGKPGTASNDLARMFRER